MRFLDNLSKTLSSGVDRAKYETDKFQRTSKINSDIANIKAQTDTNLRQLGERALELYQQGSLQAPEIASLAQLISQLRDQAVAKQVELDQANAETFEQFQAMQPTTPPPSSYAPNQNVPISRDAAEPDYSSTYGSSSSSSSYTTPSYGSSDTSSSYGSSTSSSVSGSDYGSSTPSTFAQTPSDAPLSGVGPVGTTPYACATCGYGLPEGAVFCPNCGARNAAS